MEYVKQNLKKNVSLKEIKILNKKNKKIVSTCLYIPGDLSYNMRSIYYFQGFVKSVETFEEVMNKNNAGWVYRVYYDSMFDIGLDIPIKKKSTKKMSKKQKKLEKRHRKQQITQKRKDIGGINNEYTYAFNKSNYNLPTKNLDKLWYESKSQRYRRKRYTNKQPNSNEIKIQKQLIENELTLKKLLKLYHLYLKKIKDNKEGKYDNIELISYNCDYIKDHNQFIGHSASFGMFLRFVPILDKNVDLFYSVNSTHPITPQLKIMLDDWVKNDNLEALCFCYKTNNVVHSAKKYIINNIEFLKDNIEKGTELLEIDTKFIDLINQIYNLQVLTKFNRDKYNVNERNNYTKFTEQINNKQRLSFNSIKKQSNLNKNQRGGMFWKQKQNKKEQTSEQVFYYDIFKENINYSYKSLLYRNEGFFKYAIGGGMFGLKKSFPLLKEKYDVFINFILFLIENKMQIKYGLDELLLKTILLPECFVYNEHYPNIEMYILNDFIGKGAHACYNSMPKLELTYNSATNSLNHNSFLKDIDNNPIIFKLDFIKNIPRNFWTNDNVLAQMDIFDSRAMYVKLNQTNMGRSDEKLKDTDALIIEIDNTNLCFNSLFSAYNEPKKLLLLDKKFDNIFYILDTLYSKNKYTLKQRLNLDRKISKLGEHHEFSPHKIDKYKEAFELLYIQDYNLGNIDKLLRFLITYYQIKIKQPLVEFI